MTKVIDTLNDEQKAKLNQVRENARKSYRKPFEKRERIERPNKLENGLPYATKFYPMHLVKIALLIKNNAEFRRMISLAIKLDLVKNKVCKEEDKIYISYFWNKYSISINGLKREEFYSNKEFANCFSVAINLFNNYVLGILETYLNEEFGGSEIVDYNLVEEDTKELNSVIMNNTVETNEEENGGE